MKIKKIIVLLLIIGCVVFASYFGGNVPYALIYVSILVPLVSAIYTLFIYSRLKVYQKLDNKIVLKNDTVPYSFGLANEDFFAYTSIVLKFYENTSYIENLSDNTEHILLPGEKYKFQSTIQCRYRGEYNVGLKSIEITDFLYLFRITYPANDIKTLIVLPRLHRVERLRILQNDIDPKYTANNKLRNSDYLDVDVKKYQQGDNKKLIHWKATAKRQELFSRTYTGIVKKKVFVNIDMSVIEGDELSSIVFEDRIIEVALSIIDYYERNCTPVTVQYIQKKFCSMDIECEKDFQTFYEGTAKLKFKSEITVDEMLSKFVSDYKESFFSVVVTHSLTQKLYEATLLAVTNSGTVSIIFISDDNSEQTQLLIQSFQEIGAEIIKISSMDDIVQALNI